MKDLAFLAADLWMIFAGLFFGWRFIRRYNNYLLGLEWLIVGLSGCNFLVWSLLGADEGSPLYDLAYFLDAFSRSVGITLILVLGLLVVTHRYRPSLAVEVGVFALAIVAGLILRPLHGDSLHVGAASFYVVANLLTSAFLVYVATRLWRIGEQRLAVATLVVTAAAAAVALTYDFFPLPFDDANRTIFYTAALATWGTQGCIYYLAYRALHRNGTDHHTRSTRTRATCAPTP